jgi:uncharacterized protein YigE (DUF2233 family)
MNIFKLYLLTLLISLSGLGFIPISQAAVDGIDHQIIMKSYSDGMAHRKVKLHTFIIKQDKFDVSVHSFHDLPEYQFQSAKQYRQENKALVVMSGGFYYPDFRHPVGLVVEDSKTIKSLSRHLSGVIWVKNGHLYLGESKQTDMKKIQPEFALQGYPRIVDPVNKMGIYKPGKNKAYRAAICTRQNEIILMITNRWFGKISLHELAEIAQAPVQQGGLACDIAINLDGGPAPAVSVDASISDLEIGAHWQLPNVIVVQAK